MKTSRRAAWRSAGATAVSALGVEFAVIDVPGHTAGHIAYHAPRSAAVFCGDTMFAGGCGRLFEGSPAQMVDSLGKLAALPAATRMYCAHEYTLANLRFARAVEPDNAALAAARARCQALREAGAPTVPSTIGEERATNPFVRCDEPAVRAAAERIERARRRLDHCHVCGHPGVEEPLLRPFPRVRNEVAAYTRRCFLSRHGAVMNCGASMLRMMDVLLTRCAPVLRCPAAGRVRLHPLAAGERADVTARNGRLVAAPVAQSPAPALPPATAPATARRTAGRCEPGTAATRCDAQAQRRSIGPHDRRTRQAH